MDRPRVKVLGKTARLLKLLADNPGSTVPALAVLLGEPRPTWTGSSRTSLCSTM